MSTTAFLKIDAEWKAWRNTEGCWYFYNKAMGITHWTFQSHQFDWTNEEMDAKWRASQPPGAAASLPPPQAVALKETERMNRTRTIRRKHAKLLQLTREEPDEESVRWSGIFLQDALVNARAEHEFGEQVSRAIQASAPTNAAEIGEGTDRQDEWRRLLDAACKHDAVLCADVRQVLATTSLSFTSREPGGLRAALGTVLDATYSHVPQEVAAFTSLLDRFHISEGGNGASSRSAAGTSKVAEPGVRPIQRSTSSSAVRFSGVGAGGGGGGVGIASASSTALPSVDGVSLVVSSGTTTAGGGGGVDASNGSKEGGSTAGAELAVARVIALFKSEYGTEKGQDLVPDAVGTDPEWAKQLRGAFRDMFEHPEWRKAFVQLADGSPGDRFLRLALAFMVEGGYYSDVVAAADMAGNSRLFLAYLRDATGTLLSSTAPVSTLSEAGLLRCGDALGEMVAKIDAHEFGAAFALSALQAAISPPLAPTNLHGSSGVTGGTSVHGAPNDSSAGGGSGGGGSAVVGSEAFQLARLYEELEYAVARHDDSVAHKLLVAPIPLELVEPDPTSTLYTTRVPGILDAVMRLRVHTLAAFPGLRAELFPDESIVAHIDAVERAGTADLHHDGDTDGSSSAAEAVAFTRRKAVLCAEPVRRDDVRTFLADLQPLCEYMLSTPAISTLRLGMAEHTAAIEGGEDGDGSHAAELQSLQNVLASTAFIAHALSHPDVVVYLTHILFHPTVPLDDASYPAYAVDDSGSNVASMVCSALAWLLWNHTTGAASAADSRASASGIATLHAACTTLGASIATPEDEFAWTQACATSLLSSTQMVKLHGSLDPITAVGNGSSPNSRLLAVLTGDALAFPVIALGVIHWMRHALLPVTLLDDPGVLTACGALQRVLLLLTGQWPQLHANILAAMHQLYVLVPRVVDGGAVSRHREEIAASLAELCLAGFTVPVMAYVRNHAERWDVALLRRFINNVTEGAEQPFSLTFALEFVHLVAVCQGKLIKLKESLGPDAGKASATITHNQRPRLMEALRRITQEHIRAESATGRKEERAQLRKHLKHIEDNYAKAF